MAGWIKIHRDIQNHWVFKDPFYRWWSIILLQANHRENKITLGYNIYPIKVGQCANSVRTWAILFNCSTKQVGKFFKTLEFDGMITKDVLGKGKQSTTLITINNYSKYQHKSETQGNTQETTLRATLKKRERGTTKESNNIITKESNNNINNNLMSEIKISDVDEKNKIYFKIAFKFYELFVKNLKDKNSPTKKIEKSKFKNFVNPIRLLFEQDGATREQLLKVYDFLNSNKGDFWKKNILSTDKLRKQFETLSIQANDKKSDNKPVNIEFDGER